MSRSRLGLGAWPLARSSHSPAAGHMRRGVPDKPYKSRRGNGVCEVQYHHRPTSSRRQSFRLLPAHSAAHRPAKGFNGWASSRDNHLSVLSSCPSRRDPTALHGRVTAGSPFLGKVPVLHKINSKSSRSRPGCQASRGSSGGAVGGRRDAVGRWAAFRLSHHHSAHPVLQPLVGWAAILLALAPRQNAPRVSSPSKASVKRSRAETDRTSVITGPIRNAFGPVPSEFPGAGADFSLVRNRPGGS